MPDQENENAVIKAWKSFDHTMDEIFGRVWEYGKFLIGIAIVVTLLRLL